MAEKNLGCHLLRPHCFPACLTLDAIGKKPAKTGSVERKMPSARVQWAGRIKDQQIQSWHILPRTCASVRKAGVATVQCPTWRRDWGWFGWQKLIKHREEWTITSQKRRWQQFKNLLHLTGHEYLLPNKPVKSDQSSSLSELGLDGPSVESKGRGGYE